MNFNNKENPVETREDDTNRRISVHFYFQTVMIINVDSTTNVSAKSFLL